VDNLFGKLLSLGSLRALDLSKNRFYPESLATLFSKLARASNIKALALSSVEGFGDDVAKVFVETLKSNDNIRQLNISGNKFGPQSVINLLQAIASKAVI
jgi:Ran GTPase-activating protein (RanGAP) involved in mRNA processing and transport